MTTRIAIVGSRDFPDVTMVHAWLDPVFEEYAPDYMREVMPTIVTACPACEELWIRREEGWQWYIELPSADRGSLLGREFR